MVKRPAHEVEADEPPTEDFTAVPATSAFANLPMWMRAAFFLGVPSVIAMGLVYILAVQRQQQIADLATKMDQHEAQRAHDTQTIASFLYALCLNAAEQDHSNADNRRVAEARCLAIK